MFLRQLRKSSLANLVTLLLSVVLILGFVSLGVSARAQDASTYTRKDTCSNQTLTGSYALQGFGFRGTEAPFTPYTAVRTTLFDGNGNFQGSGYQSTGGNIDQLTSTGTYQVNSDCTVTITGSINGSQANNQFGIIVDRGRKIRALRTDTGLTIKIVYEKVS